MTVYARNDVCAVVISKTHGGCGEAHSRPVVEGAPAKQWALTCHLGCEDFLRHDPLWSATPQNVPETPDEVDTRLDVEKRGKLAQERQMADSLAALAGLPAALNGLSGGSQAQTLQNLAGLSPEVLRALANEAEKRLAPEPVETPVEDAVPDVEKLSLPELRKLAQELDVPTVRSRAEQLRIVKAALGMQPA